MHVPLQCYDEASAENVSRTKTDDTASPAEAESVSTTRGEHLVRITFPNHLNLSPPPPTVYNVGKGSIHMWTSALRGGREVEKKFYLVENY